MKHATWFCIPVDIDVIFGLGIAWSIMYWSSVSVATLAYPVISGTRMSPNLYVPATTFTKQSPCEANSFSEVMIPTILLFNVVDCTTWQIQSVWSIFSYPSYIPPLVSQKVPISPAREDEAPAASPIIFVSWVIVWEPALFIVPKTFKSFSIHTPLALAWIVAKIL